MSDRPADDLRAEREYLNGRLAELRRELHESEAAFGERVSDQNVDAIVEQVVALCVVLETRRLRPTTSHVGNACGVSRSSYVPIHQCWTPTTMRLRALNACLRRRQQRWTSP